MCRPLKTVKMKFNIITFQVRLPVCGILQKYSGDNDVFFHYRVLCFVVMSLSMWS